MKSTISYNTERCVMLTETIRMLRKEKGLTQVDLSEKLHLSRATIAKYETGGIQPSVEMLERISDFFDVSVDFLLTGEFRVTKDAIDYFQKSETSTDHDSSEYETELFRIFNALNLRGKTKLLAYAYDLENEKTPED